MIEERKMRGEKKRQKRKAMLRGGDYVKGKERRKDGRENEWKSKIHI